MRSSRRCSPGPAQPERKHPPTPAAPQGHSAIANEEDEEDAIIPPSRAPRAVSFG